MSALSALGRTIPKTKEMELWRRLYAHRDPAAREELGMRERADTATDEPDPSDAD
jgi:hypothetical protein